MNQNWLVTIFFFALLLVILYVGFLILSPFLKAIAWAAILAIVVYPAYAWLLKLKLLQGRTTVAALLITVLLTLLILLPALKIGGFLSQEAIDLVKTVRALSNGEEMQTGKEKRWVEELLRLWDTVAIELAFLDIDLRKVIVQGTQLASGFLVSQVKGVAQDVFLFAANLIVTLITFFFFLRDGRTLCNKIRSFLPMDPGHQAQLFDNIVNSVFAVIHGCLLTAMVQGFLAGLAYWFLGVPFALLLGVATAFTALFPLGGSSLVWLPASAYLLVNGEYLNGMLLLAWGGGIVGTIDNVLKPLFIGSRLQLPILFLFFSILGGLRLFGVLGLILGPVLFALIVPLLDLYMKEYGRS